MSIQDVQNPAITDFSHELFGGVLVYDGAGFYPGLELLNLMFLNTSDSYLPETEEISFNRRSMEFARKLVWDEGFSTHPERENILFDDLTQNTLAKLLECLQMDIPNLSGPPSWHRAHFFPFTKNLIHYDARKKKNSKDEDHQVEVEGKYMRGAGALAFKILRFDSNLERKQETQNYLGSLFDGTEGGPLDLLAEAFQSVSKPNSKPFTDKIEKEKSTVRNDDLEDLLRDGFKNVISHTELSPVTRVKALINWVAIWLLILQAQRAISYCKGGSGGTEFFVMDIANKNTQLRRASRGSFDNALKAIDQALDKCVDFYNAQKCETNEFYLDKKRRNNIRGFFSSTAAILGVINASKGRRHFTLKVDALETLVLASIPQGEQLPFDTFLNEWLGKRCKFLIGKNMAESNNLLSRFDGAIFQDNENKLAEHLLAAGLLTQFSDATRMVGVKDDS